MPLRCLLHAGIPKTGSSSIQESLYHGLAHPGFRYVSLGEVTGGRILATAFSSTAHHHHVHRKLGLTRAQIDQQRIHLRQEIESRIQLARRKQQTLIFSSECFWALPAEDLEQFRNLLERNGYAVEVIVYLRAWKSWLESCFQEYVKLGGSRFEVANEEYAIHRDFQHHLSKLDSVFGSAQVRAVDFRPDRFPGGCVVQDFCSRTQIPLASQRIRRANEGISLPALQLLYNDRQLQGEMAPGLQSIIRNEILCRRLREVPGPRVRFHTRLVESVVSPLRATRPTLEQRLGSGFREDSEQDTTETCLADESDLLAIGTIARKWLSRATGQPCIHSGGTQQRQQLAGQMHYLFEHPSLSSRLRWHGDIFLRRIRHWLRDV